MVDVVQLLISIGAAYAYAVAAGLAFKHPRRIGAPLTTSVAIGVLAIPLLIPPDQAILRAIALLVCTELMLKMIEFARCCREQESGNSITDYLWFLIPFPPFLVAWDDKLHRRQSVDWHRALLNLLFGGGIFLIVLCLFQWLTTLAILKSSFALDHAAKIVIFTAALESLSRFVFGLERLAGFHTSPPMQYAFLSRSVPAFWSRFNQRVHAWLYSHIFRPYRAHHSPAAAVALVFLISALHHETIFGIAISRINGYQLAFFLLQIPAVLCWPRMSRWFRRSGTTGAMTAWVSTMLWLYFTSMFFFYGVNCIFPGFYSAQPWLP